MTVRIQSTSSPQSENLIRIFLKNNRSGVLATADTVGNPYAAVVYFLWEDDFSILFGTKRETQKYKNIEENNQVALVVYDEPTQTTAQIIGHTEIVTDRNIQNKVIENMGSASLQDSTENIPPTEKITAGEYVIIRIKPSVIKFAEYGFAKPDGTNLFETILFSET